MSSKKGPTATATTALLLIDAIEGGDIDECRRLVEEEGADVNEKGEIIYGMTPVMMACEKGHLDILEYLVSKGGNVDDKDNHGMTPVMLACSEGHLDILEYLVSKGANIHDKDDLGFSCLMLAIDQGHLNIAEYLLSKGANINDKNNHGNNCLMFACCDGHLDIVEYLVFKGVDINNKDKRGWNCLMLACNSGHLNIVEYLMSKGASFHEMENYRRDTCFSFALDENHSRVLYRLRKWPTTMAILVLQELALIYIIDSESVIDLHQYLGRPEDYKTDNEEDYRKDDEGNVIGLCHI